MKKLKFSPKRGIARASLVLTLLLQAGILLTACGDQKLREPNPSKPGPTFAQLINSMPDDGSTIHLSYNNFGSIFGLYGITPDSYTNKELDTKIKISNGYVPTLLQSAFSNLKPSGASNFTAQNDQVKAFGWSRFQVNAEIYDEYQTHGFGTNNTSNSKLDQVYVLRGQFDLKELEAALPAKGYQEEKTSAGVVFSIEHDGAIDPKASVFEFRIGLDNIGILADGSALVASGYKQPVVDRLQLLAAQQTPPGKTLAQNPGVKALADSFGQAQMVTIFDIHPFPEVENIATYDYYHYYDTQEKGDKATQLVKELPDFPAAKMGGLAYYEPSRGDRYYLIANYYESADQAKQAFPAMERMIKEGFPYNPGAFYGGQNYNTYMTLVESSQKDNLVVFKLKLANDTILFAPSDMDYPFDLYKEEAKKK